jgi:hypothetical protein
VAIICLYKLGRQVIVASHFVSGLASFQSDFPCHSGAALITTPSCRRGSGPQPVIRKYNLRTNVRPYLARVIAHNSSNHKKLIVI